MGACNHGGKGMGIRKNGMFYTTSMIILMAVVILTYNIHMGSRLNDKMDVVQTRIETVNSFAKDVEKDIKKGAYIAGFRTLLSFNQFISTNGTFIDDLNARFAESFLNGTFNGQELSLMEDSTLMEWLNRISAKAEKTDISVNMTIGSLQLNQSDPWNVEIYLNLTLEIQDKKNASSWKENKLIVTRVPIIEFEDPLYLVKTNGRMPNPITKSNLSSFVVGDDVTNLIAHVNSSLYTARNNSPSYLMRLEGNLGNSSAGIESLVSGDKLQQQGLPVYDRSIVDYIYFGNASTTNYRINQTPSWFQLDEAHLDFYQAADIVCIPAECVTP